VIVVVHIRQSRTTGIAFDFCKTFRHSADMDFVICGVPRSVRYILVVVTDEFDKVTLIGSSGPLTIFIIRLLAYMTANNLKYAVSSAGRPS
jgi:hypothetical protein